MKNKIRSPFFYVGDKYKIMPQIIELFPSNIRNYYEAFLGGGSSVLYVEAEKYLLNDNNKNIIDLHKYISSYSKKKEVLLDKLFELIKKYQLSCSYLGLIVPEDLKKKYVKTYYSKFNKENYSKLKNDYNEDKDISKLYLLLIYGFNHMIRFNRNGDFNLPVGNVDFNKNVYEALELYFEYVLNKNIKIYSMDYEKFIKRVIPTSNDFIYLDPPYLIANSEYNKLWNEESEIRMIKVLDQLNEKNIKFAISNILYHRKKTNGTFNEWAKKYNIVKIKSNYISYHDNTKKDSVEVLVKNY